MFLIYLIASLDSQMALKGKPLLISLNNIYSIWPYKYVQVNFSWTFWMKENTSVQSTR